MLFLKETPAEPGEPIIQAFCAARCNCCNCSGMAESLCHLREEESHEGRYAAGCGR